MYIVVVYNFSPKFPINLVPSLLKFHFFCKTFMILYNLQKNMLFKSYGLLLLDAALAVGRRFCDVSSAIRQNGTKSERNLKNLSMALPIVIFVIPRVSSVLVCQDCRGAKAKQGLLLYSRTCQWHVTQWVSLPPILTRFRKLISEKQVLSVIKKVETVLKSSASRTDACSKSVMENLSLGRGRRKLS